MPLYEYKCEQCGEVFEVRQKFADEPLSVHEKCNGKVHRLISAPALQFKGSGFYINDYAKSSGEPAKNGGAASNSNGKDSGGDSKPSTSTETKPASASSTSEKKSEKKSD